MARTRASNIDLLKQAVSMVLEDEGFTEPARKSLEIARNS